MRRGVVRYENAPTRRGGGDHIWHERQREVWGAKHQPTIAPGPHHRHAEHAYIECGFRNSIISIGGHTV